MAVVNTKSTIIQNVEASPIVKNDAAFIGGRIRRLSATLVIADADSNTSTFRFVQVHSSWSISSIRIFHDGLTGATDIDWGLYRTAADGGAAVDADCYADAINMATATTTGTEIRFNDTTTADINLVNQKVWQDAGQSSDPNVMYELVMTGNAIGTVGGDVTAIVEYTDGT